VLFTSYQRPGPTSDLLQTTKIWEAARATSAAPSFFNPIKIGKHGEEFLDGGMGANNPVRILWDEAQEIFLKQEQRPESHVKCLVSIGTGIPSLKPFGSCLLAVGKTLKSIATDTERTAVSFERGHPQLARGRKYFRFNVIRGLGNIGLERATKMPAIVAATRLYLDLPAVKREMEHCGRYLREAPRGSIPS
jgi:predicted acylesterase/phospholipase RssA